MGRKVVSFSVDHFVHWVYSISLQRLSASLLFFFLLQSSDLLHDHNKYVFRTSSFFFSFSFFFKSSVSRPQQSSDLLHDLSRYVFRTSSSSSFLFLSSSVLYFTISAGFYLGPCGGIVLVVMLLELDFDEIDASICTGYKFLEFSITWRKSVLHVSLLLSLLVVRVLVIVYAFLVIVFM
uniref:Transmembrane protein n=1 Tax=Solanum tuberosum TaxID=4113 RepID=M1BCJ6_SOLTU